MKKWILFLIMVAFLTTAAHADPASKIGVVDLQKIFKVSEQGKQVQAELNQKYKAFSKELQAKKTEIESLQDKLKRGMLAMSSDQRKEKEREIKIQVLDFKDLEAKLKNDLAVLKNTLLKEMETVTLKIAREIGAKEGFDLILEKSAGGVIYVPDTKDLTDRVVKGLTSQKK